MKRIILPILCLLTSNVFCQISAHSPTTNRSLSLENTDQSEYQYASSQGGMLNIIWENTFSDPNDWLLGDYGPVGLQWQVGQDVAPEGEAIIETINSETYEDGAALVDSDAFANTLGVENCWIQTADPIDLSDYPNVHIEFANQYYMWDGGAIDGNEYCLLELSTDGGVTWPDVETYEASDAAPGTRFELWPLMSTQDNLNNPTLIRFNISEIAGGEENVSIRFRWIGTYGYAWMIDDIKIFEGFENDLGVQGQAFAQNSAYSNLNDIRFYSTVESEGELNVGLEYFTYPASQRPSIMATTSIINWGSNDLNSIVLTGTFNEAEISSDAIVLASGTSIDSLSIGNWPTEGLSAGIYNMDIEAISEVEDDNPSDNFSSVSIEMSPFVMARDDSDINGQIPGIGNQGMAFSAGAIYEIFGDGTIYSIDVALMSSSFEGEEILVQLLDATTENFDPLAESDEIEIDASSFNDVGEDEIVWLTVPLENPVDVVEGDILLPTMTYFGGDGVHLATAQDNAADQTCFMFGDFGAAGVDWYFTNDVPMVRLNFNPNGNCGEFEVLGCTDPLACNYDVGAECNDGSCDYEAGGCMNCGCTDSSACNYNADACYDNGSCCYGVCGCLNPLASNYIENADCEAPCEFTLSGYVFNDENQNEDFDDGEFGLGSNEVLIEPAGITVFTDENGYYSANVSGDVFTISSETTLAFPIITSPNPAVIDVTATESLETNFGLTNVVPSYELEVDLFPFGNSFLCNDMTTDYIIFTNTGNLPLDGIVEYAFDELFQGYEEVTPIDEVDGNTLYMSFEDLAPGETLFYQVNLLTPTEESIGEYVSSSASIAGYYNDIEVAWGEEEVELEVTCAYDPNDKQAFPLGYTDEHWLLPETEQEFLIRFQNTGNAPAQNIRVQDTLDDNYDLDSFRFIGTSHGVMTTIDHDSRLIDFYFEGIMLPDSVNNEPDSHGFISYAVTPHANLPVGTELHNTAYIYFDNNPPIVTNTTWATIHECGGEAAFESSATELCVGEEVEFVSSYTELETYQWIINEEVVSSEESYSQVFQSSGAQEVQLVVENPLCNESSTVEVVVYDFPIAEITESGTTLTATEGMSYQWLMNGEPIEEAASQTYEVSEDGTYSVIVTNGANCSSTSAEVLVVNISETEAQTFLVYPNPMTDVAYVEFRNSTVRNVKLIDSKGKEVRVWNNVSLERLEIQKEALSAGSYILQVIEGDSVSAVKVLVK